MNANAVLSRVKREIEWGKKFRDFPIDKSKLLKTLLSEDNEHSTALLNLFKSGLNIPPKADQLSNLEALFETPEFEKFHCFVSTLLLEDPLFRNQGKHVKRIWYFLQLLGEENQRPGGYTLPDLEKFANIKPNNRTLAIKAVDFLISIGVLNKKNKSNTYPRYVFSDSYEGDSDLQEVADVLTNLSNSSKLIHKVIGHWKDWNKWEIDHDGTNKGGVIKTGMGDIVYSGKMDERTPKLVDLWADWIRVLSSVLLRIDEQPDERLVDELYKYAIRERIYEIRKQFDEVKDIPKIATTEEQSLLVVPLDEILSMALTIPIKPYGSVKEGLRDLLMNTTQVRWYKRG